MHSPQEYSKPYQNGINRHPAGEGKTTTTKSMLCHPAPRAPHACPAHDGRAAAAPAPAPEPAPENESAALMRDMRELLALMRNNNIRNTTMPTETPTDAAQIMASILAPQKAPKK